MSLTLDLTVKDEKFKTIDCKGRNGYFKHGFTQIWDSRHSESPPMAFVQIYSARRGEAAPVQLSGPVPEMIEYFESILKSLRQL